MLEKNYSDQIEKKWQKVWKEENIYKFRDDGKPIFIIDTPPPFTSGELHMGHVLSYSYIDFVARYKRMNGFSVFYPQGWDTQGFPTEVKVEKKYGKLKPEEFRKKCVEWTNEMIERMKGQMIELGFSPDWSFEYKTMDPSYHKIVQLSLIEMYKLGHIYRASYPVHWCPRCQSAIAKAELEEIEREAYLNYIKFKGPNNEDLIIATTRPELLPACRALLFNPSDERYKHLEGKKAKTPFGEEVPIIADKDVDKEFGTGLMMVCTFGDKMDVVWAHRYNLEFKEIIDENGKMKNTGEFDGLTVEEARKKIIEKLKRENFLVKQDLKKQVVKVHDRCLTPVEFIVSKQWFAAIKKNNNEIKKFANEVKWIPNFGIHYLIDWIDNAEWDWVISRQRIFGTPLPFYYCENCGKTLAAAPEDLPFYPENAKKIKCSCGAYFTPEKSVCDCWVDSSITPLVIAGWPEKGWEKFYPSSLRPQGVEIVRTWAFYTLYRCGALTNKKAWDEILLNGNVLAPDGKKMSKSLGNIISPSELIKQYPADAIRQWAAMAGAMAKDRPFSYEDLKFSKNFLTKLWNSAKFVEIALSDYIDKEVEERAVDKWIKNKLYKVIESVTQHFESYEFHHAIFLLHDFYWHDFCDNYLELIKHRIYEPHKYGAESKIAAQQTLKFVLENFLLLFAPIAPHITEEIWKNVLKKKASIHVSNWPKISYYDNTILQRGEELKRVLSAIRREKASRGKPLNSKVKYLKIKCPNLIEFKEDICGSTKIEHLEFEEGNNVEIKEIVFED